MSAIELRKFVLQEVDMLVDGLPDARLASETTAIFLRYDHLDDLPPARHEFDQRLGSPSATSRAGARMASAK